MTKVSVKHGQSAIAAMYAGLALTVVTLIVPYIDHATANVLADHIRAGLSHVHAGPHRQRRYHLPGLCIHHRSARRHLLALDNPDRQRREAMGARRRDRDVRARNRHRPVRSPRQGHLRGHRPASAAGLDRNAALFGRARSSHAALDEIVIGTDRRSGGTRHPSAALKPRQWYPRRCMTCVPHSFL